MVISPLLRQLARTRRFTLGAPARFTVAPDGARVLFLRSRAGDDPVGCLWSLDPASGAEHLLADPDVREIAHPHLARLNEACGHTVHLAVFEEGEVLYIDKVESRYPVRMYSRIGKPVAITVAAVAKLLLADLPEPERRALTDKLDYPMYTARSTPHAEAFRKELAKVREQGWATDLGGHEESINCVAAPIRGADGRVVAAMSVSAPNVVVTADELLTLLPQVRRTADAISGEYSGRTPIKEAP
ncbi:IclR family transcriptional regulator [Streptomyces sp. NPDC048279]|uniref:IclR family transcriptional regulator n=1 Tax=Streptomyces sp. NPDC048279 TaxID=3154714 RepID=UPI00343D6129